MVQLHNALQPAAASSDLIFAKTTPAASTTSATDSFAEQLATAIEGYLAQSGNGSHFEIDVQKGASKNDGFTVTVKNLDASATAATPAAPATPAAQAAAATPATVDKSMESPEDAYWAEQPQPVQALRDMPDGDKQAAAVKLAQQGYTIDVPIMVWGWDPLTTMIERQNYGYTWVPSALGSPVEVPPGLSFPGLPSYDGNNPPAGSIKVSTDFAKGTNMQNNFIDQATIEASFSS
jgi:hypothetical protein